MHKKNIVQEKFEDYKGAIRSCKSKDKKYNLPKGKGQKDKG